MQRARCQVPLVCELREPNARWPKRVASRVLEWVRDVRRNQGCLTPTDPRS